MSLQLVQTLSDRHIEQLHQLYQPEWWSQGRTLPEVRKMLSQTDLLFGWVDPSTDTLAGFCRVLTDYVYRAILLDVIVHPAYRGQGLGAKLVEQVIAHPDLAGMECIQLFCKPDVIEFYEKFDFKVTEGIAIMKRSRA